MAGRRAGLNGSVAVGLAPLDERTCEIICPIAAGMTGVCLTGIGLLRVVVAVGHRETLADNLLSLDALLFLIAALSAYLALRIRAHRRLLHLERIADTSFIAAMVLLTGVCFVITSMVNV